MLNKLKEIYDIANKLWHEDAYDMQLTCHASGWKLKVTHRYINKTGPQPEAVVFDRSIAAETVDSVTAELKACFIKRATDLADFRKNNCDLIYRQLKEANEEFTKRLFLLEELKK